MALSLPEIKNPFRHPSSRHEGLGEVPLRYVFEEAGFRITTREIKTGLQDVKGHDVISYPDLTVLLRNNHEFPIFDDGSIHFEPKHIDHDLLENESLKALGYTVFRFQHRHPLTLTRARQAIPFFRRELFSVLQPRILDLEAKE